MKACPKCRRLFEAGDAFCHADGVQLLPRADVALATEPNDERVAATLAGRYLVYRIIADGGMGRVYEAFDALDDRHVAVKVLHPEVARDPVTVERFRREYSVGRQLRHPHVVEVSEFQETGDGTYLLAMEYLRGQELRTLLKAEKLVHPARVIGLMSQLALAMDEAHRRGLVHRDLKPENLFLCQSQEGETLKVLDFGSVKDQMARERLTVMGTTIGSPFYMSPEQAQALDTLDFRTDIWAIAAITYECLCSEVPFQGSNGPSILFEILSKQPRPITEVAKEHGTQVPGSLERALLRGLCKDPKERPGSVGELVDSFGRAYQLVGDHTRWSQLSDEQLRGELEGGVHRWSDGIASLRPDEAFFGSDLLASSRPVAEPRTDAAAVGPTADVELNARPVGGRTLGLALAAVTLLLLGWWLVR